jgi:citrate lyase subunit alpha/citrate CoA-transferase
MAFDEVLAAETLSYVVGNVSASCPITRQIEQASKVLRSIEQAVRACALSDGCTVSFHHHYRNGDKVMNMVLGEIERLGLRDIRLAASSIFPNNEMLYGLIKRGVVSRIITDYIAGPVADVALAGLLAYPLVLQSHGGRARAISSGQLQIDVAFIGASLATTEGSATGRYGPCPCGPLGYAMVDARFAQKVVVISEAICAPTLLPFEISAEQVNYVVEVSSVGDRRGIGSGTTVARRTPESEYISKLVESLILSSGLLKDGFSFQTGAGGYSLATVSTVGKTMLERGVRGSFLSGGITGEHVKLLRAGIVDYLYDVQCFDDAAIKSSAANWNHVAMSAENYASPSNPNAIVNGLSLMLMGAVEVDRSFNVNVVLAGDGRVIGGPGGHPDTAEGAKLSVVTTALVGGGFSKIVDKVGCLVTKGNNVDAIATDFGLCINPLREDLIQQLTADGVTLKTFEELESIAKKIATRSRSMYDGAQRIIVEGRHGQPVDAVIR